MKLSVIIVNYNVQHYLMQCLDSVCRATNDMEAEVWVVDNASTDDSVTAVRDAFPTIHVIANTENVGFARANNMAIRRAQGEYVLLLNPDTIVGEEVLRGCTQFLDEHPEAGAVGVRMTNRDGTFAPESRRGLPTPATSFYKMCGLARLFPHSRRFGRYHMRYLDEDKPAEIDVISGAFMMLRRTALDAAGLLDEDYFMYGEDIDLSYRIQLAGWQNWYVPLRILHYKGESTQKTSYRYVHNFYAAMLIFFRKHFAKRHRLVTLVIWPAVAVMATLEMLVRKVSATFYNLLPQHKETLLFTGRKQAWSDVNDIAARANIAAISEDGDYMPTYIVFEAGETPYSEMLSRLADRAQAGRPSQLGIYNPNTNAIILPNDILF